MIFLVVTEEILEKNINAVNIYRDLMRRQAALIVQLTWYVMRSLLSFSQLKCDIEGVSVVRRMN